MSRVFLGKWWHWLIVLVSVALLWLAGRQKMHVIHFNLFVSLLIVGTLVTVVFIVSRTGQGEQVTRDPIRDDT